MMISQKALASIWILIILLVNLTEGQDNTTSNPNKGTTSNLTDKTTPGPSTTLPTPTVEPENGNTNQTVVPPTYVLKSKSGEPCLLATFNITIRVSYYVNTDKKSRKYIAFKDFRVPDIGNSYDDSVCGQNQSSLILEWGNSTFSLNMTFMSHGISEESVHTNWTLDSIVFTYNLSNQVTFPGSSEDNIKTEGKYDLDLFNTVIGHTKECDQLLKATLGEKETETVISFEYAKLAAFNLTSATFPEETEQCQVKTHSIRDEDIMVPLIIACALSFIIIVVVVAYAISRKVQEARDQSQYKPMP